MEKYKIEIQKNPIDFNIKNQIIELIKKENKESILSNLSDKILFEYLDIVVNSKFIHLFTLKKENNLVAYALLSNKPSYLISEFSQLKTKIILNLILKFKFFTIFNLIISFFKIDLIKLDKNNLKIVSENLNLNLIAVKEIFQSKGVGSYLIKNILDHFKDKSEFEYITCETYRKRAINFYVKKCNFVILGKKLRIFKNLTILSYKI